MKEKVSRHRKQKDLITKMLNPGFFPDIGKFLKIKKIQICFIKKLTQESKDSEKRGTEVR